MAVWVFVVGSAIGSFLNVVVYRLPRGLSLSQPPSHCPRCGHAIRWFHNLPVVGWVVLGGKCRDCRAAIPPRYPLVELTAGLMFVALAWLDIYGPVIEVASGEATVGNSRFPLALIELAGHSWIGSTLLAAVLIRWDGRRVPLGLVLPAIGVSILLVAVVAPERRLFPLIAAAVLAATLINRPRSSR